MRKNTLLDIFIFSSHNSTFEQLHGEHEPTLKVEDKLKEDTYTPMLEDYLKGSEIPLSQKSSSPQVFPSPTRRASKPRRATFQLPPSQCPINTIQEQMETIDLSSPQAKKPQVPPRPAPRKRVKGILKHTEQLPIEAKVEFFDRNHHTSASVRERRPNHRVKPSGYQSEMDPNQMKACSKRLRRTRSTDLIG